MDEMKKAKAKGHPNRDALYNSSPGDVRGDDTMKATMGAQDIEEVIMPRMTAVVPQEQSGVLTATPTEARTDEVLFRLQKSATFSLSRLSLAQADMPIDSTK
jgi:hypothetical protein